MLEHHDEIMNRPKKTWFQVRRTRDDMFECLHTCTPTLVDVRCRKHKSCLRECIFRLCHKVYECHVSCQLVEAPPLFPNLINLCMLHMHGSICDTVQLTLCYCTNVCCRQKRRSVRRVSRTRLAGGGSRVMGERKRTGATWALTMSYLRNLSSIQAARKTSMRECHAQNAEGTPRRAHMTLLIP